MVGEADLQGGLDPPDAVTAPFAAKRWTGKTPITVAELNRLEAGIASAHQQIADLGDPLERLLVLLTEVADLLATITELEPPTGDPVDE